MRTCASSGRRTLCESLSTFGWFGEVMSFYSTTFVFSLMLLFLYGSGRRPLTSYGVHPLLFYKITPLFSASFWFIRRIYLSMNNMYVTMYMGVIRICIQFAVYPNMRVSMRLCDCLRQL